MNENEHAVVIGGSSGMGLALAETLLAQGVVTTIVGRSAERLDAARGHLSRGGSGLPADPSRLLHTHVADVSDEGDVSKLFATTGPIDHAIVTAADPTGAYQPIKE